MKGLKTDKNGFEICYLQAIKPFMRTIEPCMYINVCTFAIGKITNIFII